MAIVFDGRAFAAKKEERLKNVVLGLKSKGITPRLASVLVGDDPASNLYVSLKKKVAQRVGIELEVIGFASEIERLNKDESVHGIMVQMPLPEELRGKTQEIINSISPNKDVDGLRNNSKFLHPTSKAVIDILKEAERELKITPKSVCVVGATGMVGTPLVKELKKEGYEVIECNSDTEGLSDKTLSADVLISTTGIAGIITGEMVKEGAVVIDVGSPVGDVNPNVSEKATFITPVPGGVGPVTISCLLENLIQAC